MSMSVAKSLRGRSAPRTRRILHLTLLFWLFSYAFLAMRGAMLEEQWAMLLSMRRAIAVAAGAGAYWIVLKKLETMPRVELGKVIGWIITATLGIMLIRLAIDQFFAFEPLPPLRNIRWSLAWSGYFGLWVMGAIAFRKGVARLETPAAPLAAPCARPLELPSKEPPEASDLEWLVNAIAPEVVGLNPSQRAEAAQRILEAGGYELADESDPWAQRHNARARLARRIAARLLENGRR
jgi:hypothetical protein